MTTSMTTITVISFMRQQTWQYVVMNDTNDTKEPTTDTNQSTPDTIFTLKKWLQERVSAFIPDITLMVGPEYPYPLQDTLPLTHLLPEHRTLHVLVSEHPRECIPWRVLDQPLTTHTELRLDRLLPDDIPYLPFWVVSYSPKVLIRQVVMNYHQPDFDRIFRCVVDALDNAYMIDSRPYFPMRYVIEGLSDVTPMESHMVYVIQKLTDSGTYRRIKWFIRDTGTANTGTDNTGTDNTETNREVTVHEVPIPWKHEYIPL